MHVKIKLFATLRKERFDTKDLELPAGAKTADVLKMIGIPEKDAALIFINSSHAGLSTVLKDGDTLSLFPPVGRG